MVCVARPRRSATGTESGDSEHGQKNKQENPYCELESEAVLARLWDAETPNQNHMMRESLNCSYARSSQRSLRDRIKSANQNSANTTSWLAGTPVGTVVLTFSDGTTQTATLTVGGNLREWYIGAFGVVNGVSDITPSTTTPYSSQVWTTTVLGGSGTAVLDMLTVPVTTANKTLTGVQLTNNNPYGGALTIDLSGLTVELAAPVPTPQPGGDCIRPGNSCTTPAAQNSQSTKWQAPAAAPATAAPADSDSKHANNGHRAH